ncbi:MAG: TolC family protein [Bacilli bacterium]
MTRPMRHSLSYHSAMIFVTLWVLFTCTEGLAEDTVKNERAISVTSELSDVSQPRVLTVRDAVDRALLYDEGIAAARDAIWDAERQEVSARQWRDPELRPSQSDERNQLSVRLYVPNPWVRMHRVDAAVSTENAVSAEMERAMWLLRTHVRRSFVEIGFLDRDLAAVGKLVELYREVLELAKQRLSGGQAVAPELVPVSGRYLTTLSDRDQAERRRAKARRELAAMVMLPVHQLVLATDNEENLPTDLTDLCLPDLEQKAIRNRGDLQASSWRANAEFATCQESRSERIPWFSHVQASRTKETGGGDEWSVEVAISIPVFSWSSRTPALAAARYHRLQAAAQEAPRRIACEVRSAWHATEDALAARRLHEERVGPVVSDLNTLHEELRKTEGMYQAQVIDVRIQLLAVERTKLRLTQDVMQALIQLEEAVGMPLSSPSSLEKSNP